MTVSNTTNTVPPTTNNTTQTNNKNSTFDDMFSGSSVKVEEKDTQQIIDDILSVLRTGLTESELEALEKILQEIKKLKKEQEENGLSDTELETMISSLELAILKIKQRVSGEAIIEAKEEIGTVENQNSKNTKDNIFEKRLDAISEDLRELGNAKDKLKKLEPTTNSEELKLIEDLK